MVIIYKLTIIVNEDFELEKIFFVDKFGCFKYNQIHALGGEIYVRYDQ